MQRGRVTPMMKQYLDLRYDPKFAGHIIFFQMGDFYELFFEDARVVAEAVGLTLTRRGTHNNAAIPMCGIPLHARDNYTARLLQLGFKVAICDQSGVSCAC